MLSSLPGLGDSQVVMGDSQVGLGGSLVVGKLPWEEIARDKLEGLKTKLIYMYKTHAIHDDYDYDAYNWEHRKFLLKEDNLKFFV